MEVFDIIPDNFFNILSSKNKRLYIGCAIQVFNVYEQGSIFGIERKIVVDELVHFLEGNTTLLDGFDSEDEDASSIRDTANFVLRRLEQTGWIYIDVTNEYVEVLNFTDYAITIIEALNSIMPQLYYNEDDDTYVYRYNVNEYQGYVFTIYSLLLNKHNIDYGILMQQILQNTKSLIRSLRKLDNRMKDYINLVVETTEIKSLMDQLVNYNIELFSGSYAKLKTGDNFNKYKLNILNSLDELYNDETAIELISIIYNTRYSKEEAIRKTYKDLDEVIDVFNAMDDTILEIDNKNKTYINTTIGKVKFLLSETDNVVGKINEILKFVKYQHSIGNVDKAMTQVNKLIDLHTVKGYSNTSLYTPRGKYSSSYSQKIDLDRFDLDLDSSLFKEFEQVYSVSECRALLEEFSYNNVFKASSFIKYNSSADEVVKMIYALIYAAENGYTISRIDSYIENEHFTIRDFEIKKDGE